MNPAAPAQTSATPSLPLAGLRVIEFTHMVMGPTCGMVLADLGAEVIKIEPLTGDNTRRLLGAGTGFYPLFNRNKKSLALDIKNPRGLEITLKLLASADVFSENFKSGSMEALGLGYAALSGLNPRLIYVSHKGFLPGPYEHRTALDEVVQMMGGLAYMTGRPGDPLRAGSSVNDIMGGMFGAIGVLAALQQRHSTGRGQQVQAALFENNVFLVAQHMMQYAISGQAAAPMPNRISPWGVYDVFKVADGEQIFLAVVSDTQWQLFCQAFGFADLAADPRVADNQQRVRARDWLIPTLRERLGPRSLTDITSIFEAQGLPFAPITRPEQLMDDPHLLATGGLAPMTLPDGRASRVPLLPLSLDGERLPLRLDAPRLGEHSESLLQELGYTADEIAGLRAEGVIS
ncbi:crotonobetainyl-CoA:carnitine CoA-transferase CaiB-like acyl-CoA transferase [Paucibacter oligotrophus]|uniref:Crotonobetainyl-CoA:carnitine CoA-transferase CaiB-like acyl-CoA transferase n=1 Tax=Roseateles oligotrophus TaxID=1769250 RepID=A0A840L589_9BURK|nr:CaiB/BaiF CoA-transferase family protein [Roseateles oligotrophus]MBB4842951.1 crotonobetainyl-CoA:carnitine CoA-transferase CaiB-like acyl-CoA transferase [Roseateles oligotrophus]